MKKLVASILTMIMLATLTCTSLAAPSISQIIPENPQVVTGNLKEEEELIVQNANPDAYENKTVAEVITWANDENTIATIKEVLIKLGVDPEQEFKTESGEIVNPTLYEQLIPFVDLVLKVGDIVKYKMEGELKAKVVIEAAKGMDLGDLLLMQIDPTTGKVYFIVPEKINSATGEIIATFPTLGPVTLLKPMDVISKDVSPEEYESKETAKVVTFFINEKESMELADVVKKIEEVWGLPGEEEKISWLPKNKYIIPSVVEAADAKTATMEKFSDMKSLTQDGMLQITDDVAVPVKDYSSAMAFADIAVKFGKDNYLYDISGSYHADVHLKLERVDWKRIVRAVHPNYDFKAAEKDMSKLTELEPFTLEDCFIMQLNPMTGDVEYLYEPEVYFAYPDSKSEIRIDEEDNILYRWMIDEEEILEEEMPDLVLNAEYKSMGPITIFMPKDAEQETSGIAHFNLWWIILIIALILAAIGGYLYMKKQKKDK